MFKIKQEIEDFYVEEIPDINIKEKGDYSYFILEKKNWESNKVISAIASKLKIKVNRFNMAGIKDKRAVTKQYVSVYKIDKELLEKINLKDIKIRFIGKGDERLKLGQLKGNKFKIKVRDVEKKPKKILFLENYFDEQRFSSQNYLIGEHLVKREFSKVSDLLKLNVKNNDHVNHIRKLGKRALRFYINAYQSYIWNESLKEQIKKYDYKKVKYSLSDFYFTYENVKNIKIPVVGFLSELKKLDKEIIKKIGVKKEDFLIREIPEISQEGNIRDAIVEVKNLKINLNKNTVLLEFELPKGSYGTLVVKKLFG